MTSFLSRTFGFVSDQPDIVTAVLVVSREITNSSAAPVTLSDDVLWDSLCAQPAGRAKEENLLKLFSAFCGTAQFTKKLRFHYRSMYTDADPKSFVETIIKNLIDNGRYFTSTLQHLGIPSADALPLVCGSKFRNLRSIHFSHGAKKELRNEDLELVCANLTLLETLDLNDAASITNFKPLSNLKNLTELNLSDTFVSDLSFAKDLKSLSKLSLMRCVGLSESNGSPFGFDCSTPAPALLSLREVYVSHHSSSLTIIFQDLQAHAPNLTSLECSNVDPEGCAAIAEMIELKSLKINHGTLLSEESLKNLFAASNNKNKNTINLPHLEVLSIESRNGVTDAFLIELLSQSSSPIRSLSINGWSPGSSASLRSLCSLKNLVSLEILGKSAMTGDIGDDHFLPATLETLNLKYCFSLTEAGLASMLKSLSLKSLCLDLCANIKSEGLKLAFEGSNCKKTLEHLSLRSNTSDAIDDRTASRGTEGVNDLSFLAGLENLKSLNISETNIMNFSKSFADKSIATVPLERLFLDSTEITDDDFANLPATWKNSLKVVSLYNCQNLTGKTLLHIASAFSSIEIIDAINLHKNQPTMESVLAVVEKSPRLKHMRIDEKLLRTAENNQELRRKLGRVISFY